MSASLVNTLFLALATTGMALLIGDFVSAWVGWAIFCAGLLLQMAFHFRKFFRLERWSRAPAVDASLESDGTWDDIFGRLYSHENDLQAQIASRDEGIAMLIAAVQSLTDGVVLLDEKNRILFCNAAAELQVGVAARTDRGQPAASLVRQPGFATYLESGDFSRPLTVRSEHIEDRVLSIQMIPFRGNRRLMQIKDVTQTDRLDRMRRDFVANVSHELRTPLTVLAGFLETLQEIEVGRDERARYLALMAEQSQRMQSIVRDLLTLSSIESAPPPGDDTVDMAGLVDKLRRDGEALAAGRLRIIVDSDGRGDLRGVEQELVSAFGNLVANAVRYTPPGGSVTISWHADTQGAEFAVMDTGIGIEPRHLPRLAERFYRVDRGRSRDAGGTGLGLAIAKHSLNRHGAQLEITSTPGVGSRFAARFPASRVTRV